jgi:hypothetical protein
MRQARRQALVVLGRERAGVLDGLRIGAVFDGFMAARLEAARGARGPAQRNSPIVFSVLTMC